MSKPLTRAHIEKVAHNLEEVMRQIDAGGIQSFPEQRAYLAGTLNALRGVLGDEALYLGAFDYVQED